MRSGNIDYIHIRIIGQRLIRWMAIGDIIFIPKRICCGLISGSHCYHFSIGDVFDVSGLTPVPSKIVAPPRVEESRVNFECRLNQIVDIGDGSAGSGFVVIGTVVLFHVDDSIYENGRINLEKLKPIGRLAGSSYSRITDTFEIVRKIRPD